MKSIRLTSIIFLILFGVSRIWGHDQRYSITVMPIDSSCASGSKRVLVHDKELIYLDADGKNLYACKDGVKAVLFRGVNELTDCHINGDTLVYLTTYRSDDTVTLIGRSLVLRTGKELKKHASTVIAHWGRTPYLTDDEDIYLDHGDSITIRSLFADSIIMRSRVNLEPETRISRIGKSDSFWCLSKLDGRNLWYVEFSQSIQKTISLPQFVVAHSDTMKPLGIMVYDNMIFALCHDKGKTVLFGTNLVFKGSLAWTAVYSCGEPGEYFGSADGELFVKYGRYIHKINLAGPS